jgi:nucleoside-diphosphate-sugar epimerase
VRTRHGKIPIIVLRIAGMYSDHCDSAPLAQQIQRVDERTLTSKVFPGDTSHGQAFVHIDGVVDTIVRTVERRGDLPHDATLLVGEPGRPPSYDELQREFARLLHGETNWPTRSIPKADRQERRLAAGQGRGCRSRRD